MRLYRAPVLPALGWTGRRMPSLILDCCGEETSPEAQGGVGEGKAGGSVWGITSPLLGEGAFREHYRVTEFERLSWQAVPVNLKWICLLSGPRSTPSLLTGKGRSTKAQAPYIST